MSKERLWTLSLLALLWSAAPVQAQAETASLRVNSNPEGATVYLDGAMRDVTPVVLSNIPPGEHLLVLKKEGYRQAAKTVNLEPGQRMVVDLNVEQIQGLVLIHSTPSDAAVRINNTDRGRTPALVTDLPLGTYLVLISAPGYTGKQIELQIESRTPKKLDVTLLSESARLVLNSDPRGASVVLNGIVMGMTPCELDRIPAGSNALELTFPGYEPFKQAIKLQAGQDEELDITLKPIPSELKIVTIPAKARIYVDNQFRGEAPVTLKDVAPGEYRVRAELKGHSTLARTVNVSRNTTLVEEFRLEVNSGILQITTAPAGVRVFVDGEEAGVTAAEEDETDRVSKPLTIRLLSQGQHKVQLTKEGFYSRDFDIDINRDETTTQHEELKRRFIPNYEVQTLTGVEKGVLLEIDPIGNIRLEIRPGIIKTIPANLVRSGKPLRGDGTGATDPD